jgi:hypothetical protein
LPVALVFSIRPTIGGLGGFHDGVTCHPKIGQYL